ncbi:MAG: ATP-dependent DNA helicase UvrD2 [Nanoarchaeota archaeon]
MSDSKNVDYIFVLKALQEIPFGVGKKLLIDFLQGKINNESVKKNHLDYQDSFGSLAYETFELEAMIDSLMLNNLIKTVSLNANKFWKVFELTPKGRQEILEPSLYKKKLSYNFKETKTEITDKEKAVFQAFGSFLSDYNDEQKKVIISNKQHILCIAGAGSGKTSVLTKRIEFLVKYCYVNPKKILAITFTRKARQEMINRLSGFDTFGLVKIETFNSFCEKILREHNDVLYDESVRVISYRDKIMIVNRALASLKIDIHRATAIYFTSAQRKGKTDEQLANIFMNDCFFIRDYFKFKHKLIDESSFETSDVKHESSARLVFDVCNFIEHYMEKNYLRDFADQLIDTISLFEKMSSFIPEFEHVLIDEYQDVNSTQTKLIDLFNSKNLFCVGDPRQSIFGWRGSDIKYILNFEDKYPDCEIITLTKNYRSTNHLVDLINKSISSMGLADLESVVKGEKNLKLLKFDSEIKEFEFVVQMILASAIPKNEIFVLARTNRQLNELSQLLKSRNIKHIVRSDEQRRSVLAGSDDVTLATIHAIKGLEADTVFVIGCNGLNFPCRGSEHPVVDMVKVDEYDKEEEERRLFYVAMSRAKNTLFLTYSGTRPTSFINSEMLKILDQNKISLKSSSQSKTFKVNPNVNAVVERLKDWRRNISRESGVPAFMILHDRTIIDLAQKMPLSTVELEDIHGFGATKIMKYGEEILDLING